MHLTSAPAWSIQGRTDEKSTDRNPGPGAYNPTTSKFENSPNCRIGTSSRDGFLTASNPGPGTYEIKSTILSGPSLKIGTSKRPPLSECEETPGPGTYEIRSLTVEGPCYTMPGRSSTKSINHSPGPGHYESITADIATGERAPSYKIGTGSRTERPSSAYVPGPGTYNANSNNPGPKWGFGSQSRENLNIFKLDIPGPGTYLIPDTLNKRGCSMTSRKNDGNKDTNPGPGSYNPTSKRQKSPSWTIGSGQRGDFTSGKHQVPGPGTYQIKAELGKTAPLFGSSKRPPLSDINDTPGPGEYFIHKGKDAPAYTMRPKTATNKKEFGPGPGHYNPSASCTQFKWTIGKEKKEMDFGNYSNKVPGPGVYNTMKGLGGPKWTFGTQPRTVKNKVDNPGPGSYNLYSSISNLPRYAVKASR